MFTMLRGKSWQLRLLNWPLTNQRRGFLPLKISIPQHDGKSKHTGEAQAPEEETTSPMALPHFIDAKCVRSQSQSEEVQGEARKFVYNYHPFSIFDLNEAALRAKQATAKYAKDLGQKEMLEIEYKEEESATAKDLEQKEI